MSPTAPALRVPEVFHMNARVYTSATAMALLRDVAREPGLALVVDVDALERSRLARIDQVMRLALGALQDAGTAIVLLAWDAGDRADQLHRAIPGSIRLAHTVPNATLEHVRGALPTSPLVCLSDSRPLLDDLSDRDRGLALGSTLPGRGNVIHTSDLAVRATLWWLVDRRCRSSR